MNLGYKNCHLRGLHSLIIGQGVNDNIIRLFIAEKNHELWKNDVARIVGQKQGGMSLAFHSHKSDITLVPISGVVRNISIVKEQVRCIKVKTPDMKAFIFKSAILGQGGNFEKVDEDAPSSMRLRMTTLEKPLFLKAADMHTIYVPKGQSASWLVLESGKTDTTPSVVYSNAPLENWSSDGLYQPIENKKDYDYLLRKYFYNPKEEFKGGRHGKQSS